MSSADISNATADSPSTAPSAPEPQPLLRLRVPIITLVLFWVIVEASYQLELAMFPRFATRMLANVVLLLVMLGWWLTNRHFRRRERWLILGIMLVCLIAAAIVADPTVNAFAMILIGLPWIATIGTLWLAVSKSRPIRTQLVGLGLTAAGVFAALTLFRWEGLDGRQRNVLSWRWTPTAESQFLDAAARPRDPDDPFAPAATTKPWHLDSGDWPVFRGSERDGIAENVEFGAWSENPPGVLWRHRIGPAWSSMIHVGGYIVTQEQRGESEVVACYDGFNGDEYWVHKDPVRFTEGLSGTGPRSTPAFCDGRIYAVGGKGLLNCLDAESGQIVWSHDLIAETGAELPQWGVSTSPLIVDNLVVVFAGGKEGRSLLAFEPTTGTQVWAAAGGKQSFSSPQLMTIAGVRQIVMHDNGGLAGFNIEDGALLWRQPGTSEMFIPMLQPHLVDGTDLIVGWDNGIARIAIARNADTWTISEKWQSNRLKPSFNDFVIHKGRIYGLDDGILCCTDAESGRRLWKNGRYGFGQLLLVPESDRIVVLTENGEVVLVATNPEKLEELGRFSAIAGKTWNHPLIAHERLYARNAEEIACFRLEPEKPRSQRLAE